jgi:FkbM family methyltransferase
MVNMTTSIASSSLKVTFRSPRNKTTVEVSDGKDYDNDVNDNEKDYKIRSTEARRSHRIIGMFLVCAILLFVVDDQIMNVIILWRQKDAVPVMRVMEPVRKEQEKQDAKHSTLRPASPITSTSSSLISTNTPPLLPPLPLFEMKDAGMCPPRTCPGIQPIRNAWTDVVASSAADEAEDNPLNAFAIVKHEPGNDFTMMLRDIKLDKIISGSIRKGQRHDPLVGNAIAFQLQQRPLPEGQTQPVFIDAGANIGYFTSLALALGAYTISFEPMRPNLGALMSTVHKNNWQSNSRVYHNALSYEGAIVNMESTTQINLSNGYVTNYVCSEETQEEKGQYGVDWMESVSLDQVMLTNHPEIKHVQVMKIDVESFEVHVINGAMRFLCNSIVEMILMEVEYIRPGRPKTICNSVQMQTTLETMGYTIWSDLPQNGGTEFTGKPFNQLPSNVNFVQQFRDQTPAERLKGTAGNPCAGFEI